MAVMTLLRVRTGADPADAVDWDPDTLHVMSDAHPIVYICVRGDRTPSVRRSAEHQRKLKFEPVDPDGGGDERWFRCPLGVVLAEARRVGRMRLELVDPGATIQLYVLPEKLLRLEEVRSMLEEAERALGRMVAWRPRDRWRGAAWVAPSNQPGALLAEQLDRIEAELAAARQLRVRPMVEPAPVATRKGVRAVEVQAPELALVSHWAVRRLTDLGQLQRVLRQDLAVLAARMAESKPALRAQQLAGKRALWQAQSERIGLLRAHLGGLVRRRELDQGIPVGPLVQRDHRLRRLLRAFVPTTVNHPSDRRAPLSRYPPALLTGLFEIWGAVWIVAAIESLGFEVVNHSSWGMGVQGCRWRLERSDGVVVTLDYEPDPIVLELDRAPAAHLRAEDAVGWVARNTDLPAGRPFFSAGMEASPDYLIRVERGAERWLLVGDASLADPAWQEGEKLEKVARYVRGIGWRSGERVVRCHPMGGFVLLTPPQSSWQGCETLPKARDITVCAPSLHQHDGEARQRFQALFEGALGTRALPVARGA